MRQRFTRVAGRINLLVLLGLVAIGGAVAYFYLTQGGAKATDKALKETEKLVDQAGKDLQKSAAENAADLERRNQSIQHKRGFDIAK